MNLREYRARGVGAAVLVSLFALTTIACAVGEPDCVGDFWSCSQDSDCIEVPADPCGCANGGQSTTVNEMRADD